MTSELVLWILVLVGLVLSVVSTYYLVSGKAGGP